MFLFALAWRLAPNTFHRGMNWAALATPAVLCLLSVWLIVTYALSTRWTVLGVVQHSDAADFLLSVAETFRQGWFDTPRGRPLANLSWVGLLDIADFNVTMAGYVIAVVTALAILAATLAARISYSVAAALLGAVFLFDYFHEFFVGISSEMPGFLLGCVAAAALLRAAQTRNVGWFLTGFALFASGMLVRPGVMFLLPALLVWGIWWYAHTLKGRAAVALAAIAILGVLFTVNGRVAEFVTPNSGGTFVNAADSWYAIFENGREALDIPSKSERLSATRWRQIYEDYPEIEALPLKEQASRKIQIIKDQVLDYRLAGLVGALLELKLHFVDAKIFRFIEVKPFRYLAYIFFLIGAVAGIRRAVQTPEHSLHAAIFCTTFLSVPFMHGGESRGFAASAGLMALTVSYGAVVFMAGMSALGRRFMKRKAETAAKDPAPISDSHHPSRTRDIVVLAAVTALPALFLAVLISDGLVLAGNVQNSGKTLSIAATCPEGATAVRVTLSKGSQVTIVPDAWAEDGNTWHGDRVFTRAMLQTHHDWQADLATTKSRWRYVASSYDYALLDKVAALVAETGRPYTVQQAIGTIDKGLFVLVVETPRADAVSGKGPQNLCVVERNGLTVVLPDGS